MKSPKYENARHTGEAWRAFDTRKVIAIICYEMTTFTVTVFDVALLQFEVCLTFAIAFIV